MFAYGFSIFRLIMFSNILINIYYSYIAIYLYINVLKDIPQKIQTYLFVGFHTFKHILK